ncbi:hypothetical protein LOC69_22000 [Blastopirellula sp. JC733]|nr:hypothetical protein [Blastopirellula sediminis]
MNKPWMPIRETLASVVDTPEQDLRDDPAQLPHIATIANQTIDLDRRIRDCLALGIASPSQSQDVAYSKATEPTLELLTPLQREILKVLNGKNMTKQQLADAVCGGDGSRLYKKGGLKELMKNGRLSNQRKGNVGYYRPDSPPLELLQSPATGFPQLSTKLTPDS